MSESADFEAAFLAEYSDFNVALQEQAAAEPTAVGSVQVSKQSTIVQHVGTLRAMAIDAGSEANPLFVELHGACVQKARDWVEKHVQALVAEFHMRWAESGGCDLIAVDDALRSSLSLVKAAEAELGALPICTEVIQSCEHQLRAQLQKHVRSANRHELRMLFADFCRHEDRAELQSLCLDKYREQVDKHVQSEAVQTQMRLMTLLAKRDATAAVVGSTAAGSAAGISAAAATEEKSTVSLVSDYLEGVAALAEELDVLAEECRENGYPLPTAFVGSVLREVEQEASTQALELCSHVLQLEDRMFDAVASCQALLDQCSAVCG